MFRRVSDLTTFVDLYLIGACPASEIDNAVAAWHQGTGHRHLHDYLGLTRDEYAEWVAHPERLVSILERHRP